MKSNEITVAADKARERHDRAKTRGASTLAALMAARSALNTAEAAHTAALQARDALAEAYVAGEAVDAKAVSSVLQTIESAARDVGWCQAVVAAAQRGIQAAQADLKAAETEALEASERSRKSSLHSRVLELAGQA